MSVVKRNKKEGFFPTISSFVDDWFHKENLLKPFSWRDWVPAANVKDEEKVFTLELSAPGYEKDDFVITLDKGVLHVRAEKKEESKEEDDNYTRKEFGYHSFTRSFWMPENTKEEDIVAEYKNGILWIKVPKTKETEEASVTKIPVT